MPSFSSAPPPPPPASNPPNAPDRFKNQNRAGYQEHPRQQNWTRGKNRGGFNRNNDNNTNRRFNDNNQYGMRNNNFPFKQNETTVSITIKLNRASI